MALKNSRAYCVSTANDDNQVLHDRLETNFERLFFKSKKRELEEL